MAAPSRLWLYLPPRWLGWDLLVFFLLRTRPCATGDEPRINT
jgi:hypothetical protein